MIEKTNLDYTDMIDVTAGAVDPSCTNAATDKIIRLQADVRKVTKDYLRLESVRRSITMGQLLDEVVALLRRDSVSENNS